LEGRNAKFDPFIVSRGIPVDMEWVLHGSKFLHSMLGVRVHFRYILIFLSDDRQIGRSTPFWLLVESVGGNAW
jgi:hypothetical protein